jgi:hypothetical protein
MKFLDKLIKKPQVFQRTIGLNIEQFRILAEKLRPEWEKAEKKLKERESRKRKIGGGRSCKLETIEAKLAAILMYYKTYMTQEFLGTVIDLDQSNVSRLIAKLMPLIEQAADPELRTFIAKMKAEYEALSPQQKIGDWQTFFQQHPDVRESATDATEHQCYRSKNYEVQKKHYSGKKKMHTLKTQLTVASTGRILDVSNTYPGSVHDKTLLDQEKTIEKLPERTCQRLDLGYQGVVQKYPKHYAIIPIKKPKKNELTPLEKELNQLHSSKRIIAEHVISRLKKFKICKNTFRGRIGNYNQIFSSVAALLNFKLKYATM